LSNFNQIWNVDSVCQEKELVLSVTPPEVIYMHACNLISGLTNNLLKLSRNVSLPAKCYRKSGSLNPFPVILYHRKKN